MSQYSVDSLNLRRNTYRNKLKEYKSKYLVWTTLNQMKSVACHEVQIGRHSLFVWKNDISQTNMTLTYKHEKSECLEKIYPTNFTIISEIIGPKGHNQRQNLQTTRHKEKQPWKEERQEEKPMLLCARQR